MLDLDASARPIISLVKDHLSAIVEAREAGHRVRAITDAVVKEIQASGRQVAWRTVYEYVRALLKKESALTKNRQARAPGPTASPPDQPTKESPRGRLSERLSSIPEPQPMPSAQSKVLGGASKFVSDNISQQG